MGKKGKQKKRKLKQKTFVSNCNQLSMRKTVSEMSTLPRFGPLEAGAGDFRTVALVTMWILASPCPLITAHFLNTKLGSVAKKTKKNHFSNLFEGRSVQHHQYLLLVVIDNNKY